MILVHKAEKKDLNDIIRVLKDSWTYTFSHIIEKEKIAKTIPLLFKPKVIEWQITDPHSVFNLAKDDNRTVGIINCSKLDYTSIMLHHLAVLPDYHQRGIGTLLLNSVIDKFKYLDRIILKIEETNHRGQSFCVKKGFKYVQTLKEFVGEMALKMVIMELKIERKDY